MTTAATIDALKGKRIVILGYGSQGRAHALNLHESGLDVVVGVRRDGPSWIKAQADGLRVEEPAEAVKQADLVAVLKEFITIPLAMKPSWHYSSLPHLSARDSSGKVLFDSV